ncbi:MAG: CHASE4 domain-containing protein [Methanomicrobiaceae archaeon]|nr:CHASE4 domain-containing protein [Methanomicrobiaceae archaeon]
MKIRNKVFLIILFYFFTLFCGIYLCSDGILLRGVQEIELDTSSGNYHRAIHALDFQLDEIATMNRDWAWWDDTYEFMVTGDERYIQSNLVDDTYLNAELNLICYFDTTGTLLYGRTFDHAAGRLMPLPENLDAALVRGGVIGDGTGGECVRGIISAPDGRMLISAEPIRRSDSTGPSRGTLIMGRYLENGVLEKMKKLTSLSIAFFDYGDPAVDEGLVPVDASLDGASSADMAFFYSRDGQKISCIGTIKDVAGTPALVLRTEEVRQTFLHGMVAIHYYVILLLGISLGTSLLLYAFLRGHIITRIEALRDTIIKIADIGEYSSRVDIDGDDEISDLSVSMNGMLASLEQGQQRLRESEERYRQIFDNAQDAMIVCQCTENDEHLPVIVNVNGETCRLLGYNESEIRNSSPADIIHPDFEGGFSALLQFMEEQHTIRVNGALVSKTGSRTPIEMSAHLFAIRDIRTFIIVARDITERRVYESMRQEAFEQIDKNMEQFAILNDEIRNPLQVILGFLLIDDCDHQEQIIGQIEEIDRIITELDLGWIESEKVRKFLRKYHGEY